jgi:hypothetical protein
MGEKKLWMRYSCKKILKFYPETDGICEEMRAIRHKHAIFHVCLQTCYMKELWCWNQQYLSNVQNPKCRPNL